MLRGFGGNLKQRFLMSGLIYYQINTQKVRGVEKSYVRYMEDEQLLKDIKKDKESWYDRGNEYWQGVKKDNNGIMGGYGIYHGVDIRDSQVFLDYLIATNSLRVRGEGSIALDCGSGIGRVTKEFLIKNFKRVDLVEQSKTLIEASKENLRDHKGSIGEHYNEGLQNFRFDKKYDCVWVQWVSNQLTDKDLTDFLKRARESLTPEGVIVLKENVSDKIREVDLQDFSTTRSLPLFQQIFQKAGLRVVSQKKQTGFPSDLYDILMFALVPDQRA